MISNIISIPRAGLGNKLRNLISCKILSEQLSCNLLIKWESDNATGGSFGDLFEYNDDWKPYYNEVCDLELIIDTDEPNTKSLADFKPYTNVSICGYARFSYDMDLSVWFGKRDKYLQQLVPNKTICDRLFKLPENAIGVHIRRGDNIPAIDNSPITKFIKIIEENQDKTIYLATDNLTLEQSLLSEYSNIITQKKTQYNPDGQTIGSDPLHRHSIINSPTTTQEALVDMLMLSRTSTIYGSYYSSFGEHASKFNNIPLVTVI